MDHRTEKKSITFLDGDDVERYLDLRKLIASIEKGIANFSKGQHGGVIQPVRTSIPVQEHNGVLLVMPAYSFSDNALGTKLLTLYRDNEKHGIKTHVGVMLVFEPETGHPLAVIDAEYLSALRTAAATAVATKYLSKEDAKTLAIIGAGNQARSHFKLLSLVRKFSEVKVWSRTKSSCEKFCQEINGKCCSTVEEAVRDADVIVTVTMSKDPVVCGKWINQDALVNIIGACRPDWREADDELMHASQIIVDTREAAMKESGDVILSKIYVVWAWVTALKMPKAAIHGELGEIILGTIKADFNKIRVFKSLGMAVEDAIAGKLVYDQYLQIVSKL